MNAAAPNAVDPRRLRALVAITEEGGFSAAAARLSMSQPAVSRAVAGLESDLGARLVTRTTRSLALTDAGQRVYRAAVLALRALDDVANAARGDARPLRLGYSWSAFGAHTSAVLRGWRAAHPEVPLEIHRVDAIDGGLGRGVADVAVIRGEFERSDCVTEVVFREPRMAALPADHPLAAQPSVLLAELRDETVVTTAYGTTRLELWPADVRPASVVYVDNTDEWLAEIAGGLGVGVTAESTSAQHPRPDIAFVPVDDAEWLSVLLAWPAGDPHPATAEFSDHVRRVVADRSPHLEN